MICVSPLGIHISLVICVRGYTYHGDTNVTVTAAIKIAPESYRKRYHLPVYSIIFIALIRACVPNEILKRVCYVRGRGGGGAVLGIVGGGVTFRFLNRDAISDQNMPFFIRSYPLVVPLKAIPFSDYNGQNHISF